MKTLESLNLFSPSYPITNLSGNLLTLFSKYIQDLTPSCHLYCYHLVHGTISWQVFCDSLPPQQTVPLKWKLYITALKTFSWFAVSLRIKIEVLTMCFKVLHHQALVSSLIFSSATSHCSLDFSHTDLVHSFSNMPSTVPPQGLCAYFPSAGLLSLHSHTILSLDASCLYPNVTFIVRLSWTTLHETVTTLLTALPIPLLCSDFLYST